MTVATEPLVEEGIETELQGQSLDNIHILNRTATSLPNFLMENDFQVEQLDNGVIQATRAGELPILMFFDDGSVYFRVVVGDLSPVNVTNTNLLLGLLSLNTQILPVSVAVDLNEDSATIILVESRESENLDANELFAVISSLELAQDEVQAVLTEHLTV